MKPGERLRLLRQAKSLKKHQLFKLVNELGGTISSGYISNLESGKANSEHLGIHYLRTFARALEVREHVMTSEIRDSEIQTNAAQVLVEEVLEVFLSQEGSTIDQSEGDLLRRVVKRVGGPKWCSEWSPLYQRLTTYRTLSDSASPAGSPRTTPPLKRDPGRRSGSKA